MQYKTIALELVQENPALHDRLRLSRKLLSTVHSYAIELKASHETWKEQLRESMPTSDPSQIASVAMERAVQEMTDRLSSVSEANEADPLSLDAAMNSLRHSRRA
jgi:hypothetical protein